MSSQLPLGLRFAERNNFDSFFPGPNRAVVRQLIALLHAPGPAAIYLRGESQTGKSHLLQAALRAVTADGRTGVYLPLSSEDELCPELLLGMEALDLVCLDDIDRGPPGSDWTAALAGLLTRAGATSGRVLLSGRSPPEGLDPTGSLGIHLGLATVLELYPLTDSDKTWALQARARERGLKLPEHVGRWLLRHYSADLGQLTRALESLDYASLAAQRKLTVPFIRNLLGGRG